jgi:hypothetical protein
MQSKNKRQMTLKEAAHVERVKALPCSVCDKNGPSEAHELKQGQWYTAAAICDDCHRGPINGWHGQRRIWLVRKMDELDALAITLQRIF